MTNQFQKDSTQENVRFDQIVMKQIKSFVGKPPVMVRLGHWKFEIIPKVSAGNIDYEIYKMVFVRDDIGAFDVKYDEIYLPPEDVHELIVSKLAFEFSDIFLQPTPQEETDESRFINNTIIQRLVS